MNGVCVAKEATTLLYENQKLQLLQQYIYPIVNYAFQITPSALVSQQFLNRMDLIVTSGMRELLQLPNGCPNDLFYASRACGGLAVPKFFWESRIQRLSAIALLLKHNRRPEFASLLTEVTERCFRSVQVPVPVLTETFNQPDCSGKLRKQLRQVELDKWVAMKGLSGVCMYPVVPAANTWISRKNPLSMSDWLMSFQLRTNTCAVATHPRTQQTNKICRRCGRANETIGHVLGMCSENMHWVTKRHNEVVEVIFDSLRKNEKFDLIKEMQCSGFERRARPGEKQSADLNEVATADVANSYCNMPDECAEFDDHLFTTNDDTKNTQCGTSDGGKNSSYADDEISDGDENSLYVLNNNLDDAECPSYKGNRIIDADNHSAYEQNGICYDGEHINRNCEDSNNTTINESFWGTENLTKSKDSIRAHSSDDGTIISGNENVCGTSMPIMPHAAGSNGRHNSETVSPLRTADEQRVLIKTEEFSNVTNVTDEDYYVRVPRRIDIVAIAKDSSCLYLIGPTIQTERDENAVVQALREKEERYRPTVRWFREQYPNIRNVKVCGVWFGARGAHHPTTISLFKELGILTGNSRVLLDSITKIILRHSSGIMQNHLRMRRND